MSKLITDGFNPKIEYKGGFDQILIVEFYNSENSDNLHSVNATVCYSV